jgi:hypothetical protein
LYLTGKSSGVNAARVSQSVTVTKCYTRTRQRKTGAINYIGLLCIPATSQLPPIHFSADFQHHIDKKLRLTNNFQVTELKDFIQGWHVFCRDTYVGERNLTRQSQIPSDRETESHGSFWLNG